MWYKINTKRMVWAIIIYIFAFQRVLTDIWNGFNYIDEIFAIFVLIKILIHLFNHGHLISKYETKILLLLTALITVGTISSLFAGLLNEPIWIVTDILAVIKVWGAYYAITLIHEDMSFFDGLIIDLAKISRLLVCVMTVCLLLSQMKDIGMTAGERMGIKAFQFVFNNPGNYSKFFYFLVPLLSADLAYKRTPYKKLTISLSLVLWISTLRTRAMAFVIMYVLLYFCLLNRNKKTKDLPSKRKIKVGYIIPIVTIIVIISWRQIIYYFTNSRQARAVLLRYGIITLMRYFPLGSGFGTFGSDVASKCYSKLYLEYGFNAYYGMRQGEEYYLNDNYWPMIMGQFGFIGLVIMSAAVIGLFKYTLKETRNNKYFYFSVFCIQGFLLLSSVASKSYAEYSSMCVFMLLGTLVNRERKRKLNVK